MPKHGPTTREERANHVGENFRSRLDASVVPECADLAEGAGSFPLLDGEGQPIALDEGITAGRIGSPEPRDGWSVWAGRNPVQRYRLDTVQIPYDHATWRQNGPIDDAGTPLPSPPYALKVAPPLKPILKAVNLDRVGYGASTPQSPHFVRLSWGMEVERGRILHTTLGPATPFQAEQGQSWMVYLDRGVPRWVTHVGVWAPVPGASSPFNPGVCFLQQVVDVRDVRPETYPLWGPFRKGTREPTRNQTRLGAPPKPKVDVEDDGADRMPGKYVFAVTWADRRGEGETMVGVFTRTYVVDASNRRNSKFVITAPRDRDARGYRLWVRKDDVWHIAYNQDTDHPGTVNPFSLKKWVYGVTLEQAQGQDDDYRGQRVARVIEERDPPRQDTTGVDAPDSEPPEPYGFGRAAPQPGPKYVQVAEWHRGKLGPPSPTARIDLDDGQTFAVIRRTRHNAILNADHQEVDEDGHPLYHTIVATGGAVEVEGTDLVMRTASATTGATPTDNPDWAEVDVTQGGRAFGLFAFEPPATGTLAGEAAAILEERDASGAVTSRTLASLTAPGEASYGQPIDPPGTVGSAFAYAATTVEARVRHLFRPVSGGSKNGRIRILAKGLRDHANEGLREIRLPPRTPPGQKIRPPAEGETAIEPAPEIVLPPETFPLPGPDRPVSDGAVLHDFAGFEGADPLAGWTTEVSGSGSVAVEGATGSKELVLKDTGAASGSAAIARDVPVAGRAEPDRHDLGLWAELRMAVLPANGSVAFNPVCDADGNPLAWAEIGSEAEVQRLTVESSPLQSGSVTVTPEGSPVPVAVVAQKERVELVVSSAPANVASVTMTLNNAAKAVSVQGVYETLRLIITEPPPRTGYFDLFLAGVRHRISVIGNTQARAAGDTTARVASRVINADLPGWRATQGTGASAVILVALTAGNKSASWVTPGTSGLAATLDVTKEGTVEAASALAARILATPFPGWVASQGGTAETVVFDASTAGARSGHKFSHPASGAVTVTNEGSADMPTELAARIRAAAFTGWTTGGTGAVVSFTATTGGARAGLGYSDGGTGVRATATVTKRGTNADLLAVLSDPEAAGGRRTRKMLSALAETQVFEVDSAVSGAGTEDGIISFWGRLSGGTMSLLARFEGLDLTLTPTGKARLGVVSESLPATTWEMRVLDAKVTDRGVRYHRDHDRHGRVVNRIAGSYPPGSPLRQDLLLQDFLIAVVPGELVTIAAFLRNSRVAPATHPLVVEALMPDGTVEHLGDAAGDAGISGTGAWREVSRTYAVPVGCLVLRVRSRDVSYGTVIIQEIVPSGGSVVDRSGLYAPTAAFSTVVSSETPRDWAGSLVGKRRVALDGPARSPEGTSATFAFASGASAASAGSAAALADPALVPDLPFVRADAALSSSPDRLTCPVVPPGSPRYDTEAISGRGPVAVLLTREGKELPGGAILDLKGEVVYAPWAAAIRRPDGSILSQRRGAEPVGTMPGGRLLAFTPEAVAYLSAAWTSPLIAEIHGVSHLVSLAGVPEFEQQTASRYEDLALGLRGAFYEADLAPSHIVASGPLGETFGGAS